MLLLVLLVHFRRTLLIKLHNYTVNSCLLLYLPNTTVFVSVILFYFVVFIRNTLKAGRENIA